MMIELPEARVYAEQLQQALAADTVVRCVAGAHPHKMAFYEGDPQHYPDLLEGGSVQDCRAWGGLVELCTTKAHLLVGDGVRLRLLDPGDTRPDKHQLQLVFASGRVLTASIQMYGGIWVYLPETFNNPYYRTAKEKPSPLSDAFDSAYWNQFLAGQRSSLSMKALLATEQRIPGLGNGVLQDILWHGGLHPKAKLMDLTPANADKLYAAIKETLQAMVSQGGRSTEQNLWGEPGGYPVQLSARTSGKPCPACSTAIESLHYMGGRVYFCPSCQPVP